MIIGSNIVSYLKSKQLIVTAGIIIVFILMRLINLDADIPSFKLMNISSIDEFYYSVVSFNLVHYGSVTNYILPEAENDAVPFMLLLSGFNAITLQIFGNNYFGLRLGSLLCSLVLFLFYLNIIKKTSLFGNHLFSSSTDKLPNYVLFFVLLFFACDFSFLVISRVAAPEISRSLTLVILLWFVATKNDLFKSNPYLYSFIFGFLALFSVWFGYIYNLFFAGACGFTLFFLSYKEKKVIFNACFFILGALVCSAIYEACCRWFFDKSFFDYFQVLSNVSKTRVDTESHGLANFVLKIKTMFFSDFSTNMFRLNAVFFIVSTTSIPIFFYRMLKYKKSLDVFIACLFILWIIQSFFENSYPLRRHTIMFPVFVLMIIYSFEEIEHFIKYVSNHKLFRTSLFLYYFLIVCVFLFNTFVFFKMCKSDYTSMLSFWLLNFICGLLVIAILIFCALFKKHRTKLTYFISLMLLIPSLFLLFNKVLINATYYYKQTMIEIGKQVGDEVMIGGVSYAFRLYGNSKPTLNLYAYMNSDAPELKRRLYKLLISYDYFVITTNNIRENENAHVTPMEIGYLKKITKQTGYTFEIVKAYNIGDDRHVFLMKKQNHNISNS